MDLITTRGVFGDSGRLKKGHVVKNVAKALADKLLKSGAYAEATPEAIKAAQAPKKIAGAKAKAKAAGKKTSSSAVDGKAVDAAVETAMKKAREEFATAMQKAGETLQSLKAEVEALTEKLDASEKRHAEEIARLASASPSASAGAGDQSNT